MSKHNKTKERLRTLRCEKYDLYYEYDASTDEVERDYLELLLTKCEEEIARLEDSL